MIAFKNISSLNDEIKRAGCPEWLLVSVLPREFRLSSICEKRMRDVGTACGSSIVYSDCWLTLPDGSREAHPTISYQPGSLRDDFDFGGLILVNCAKFANVFSNVKAEENGPDGGLYALRLALSSEGAVTRVPEFLYEMDKTDFRASGEKQHDYVKPSAREYQIAMEKAVTVYLRRQKALLPAEKESVEFDREGFEFTASVVIPVRNRVKTVGDAVRSALGQRADFPFNVIVVDNDSSDGTRELLDGIDDSRLVVVKVDSLENLGIGGCWNRALTDERCGMFAVQLDSDDIYSSPETLQKIVDKFRETKAAMVIGSYTLTDFDLNVLPPGIIDHAEWTDDNGANNALRINGFGAPRAFYTPIARSILFPNVSYGEDYAMALRISRTWRVGRIYEPLYLCRRWNGNSDAAVSPEKVNEHNYYKDFIRTCEFLARKNGER